MVQRTESDIFRDEVARLDRALHRADEELHSARQEYDDCRKVRDQARQALDDYISQQTQELPLFDRRPAPAGEPAWRAVPIEQLELTAAMRKALVKAGLTHAGQVADRIALDRLAGVKGLTGFLAGHVIETIRRLQPTEDTTDEDHHQSPATTTR